MKPNHRLLFIQHASIFEQYGGVEYYLDDFTRLAHKDFPLSCSLIPISAPPKVTREYSWHPVYRSSYGWLKKIENRFSIKMYLAARKLIRSNKPTIIINSHVSLGPLSYLLAKQYKIPVITIVYGIDAWRDLFFQDEWCLQHSQRIISISQWTKNILVNRGYQSEKIDIVNPLLNEIFIPAPLPKRQSELLTLLSVSRLDANEQYKGQDHVLLAIEKLAKKQNNLKLKYIIQGDGTDRNRLEQMVKTLGISQFVEFRNPILQRESLREIYREADVFIMPSRYGKWGGRWKGEGFGIVYAEAASMKVPSIAYNCGGATEIIIDGKTGWLIDPDNIDELANKIFDLIQSPEQITMAGEKARELVLSKFTAPAVSQQIRQSFALI